MTDGDHNPPKRTSTGVPHFTARNIRRGRLTAENCTFISERDFAVVRQRYDPSAGDVIVTCVGTLGATALVPEGLVFSADRNLAAIRPSQYLVPQFLALVLNTALVQRVIADTSGSTAQPHLYLGDLRALEIPLPPIAEQVEVVRSVASLFDLADVIELRIEGAIRNVGKFPQAILSKAFSGELVPAEAELARVEKRSYRLRRSYLPASRHKIARQTRNPSTSRVEWLRVGADQ